MAAVCLLLTLLLQFCLIIQATNVSPCRDAEDIECLRKHHRVTQVAGGRKPAGPVAVLLAYMKTGVEPPASVVEAAERASKIGSAEGTNYGPDAFWLFPITVGGKSHLNVVFDTGSADLWLFSTITPPSQRGNHSLYDVSTGKRDGKYHFKIQYAQGSSSGPDYGDSVRAGGITAQSMDVGAATQVAKVFQTQPLDGIMGFSLFQESTCKPTECFPFFHQIRPQLTLPLFAVALQHNGPGIFDFGFIDSTLYTGSITYSPRYDYNLPGAWGARIQGWQVGSKAKENIPFFALIDTGTSLAFLPDAVVADYYQNVPGATFDSSLGEAIVFPCSSIAKLPKLSFKIGGQYRTIPGGEYGVYRRINQTYCFGAIQSGDAVGAVILGDMFLRTQYVIFNTATQRIGFAQQSALSA